jgi:hypothetical protein
MELRDIRFAGFDRDIVVIRITRDIRHVVIIVRIMMVIMVCNNYDIMIDDNY